MNTEIKRIQGIVDEMIANSLHAKATDISVSIKRMDKNTVICVKDNGSGMDEKTRAKIEDTLNQPNRTDLEEYYGNLAGGNLSNSGLNMVGMLVDYGFVETSPKGTTITVHRRHKQKP
jgi:sensor histidine kinase YesM